ncbi:hypothetical protein KSS87_005764 [Heliosperma pusillum]|nr:hypothetical protein KSS87_005764 [Heliosperma pusillum]
MHKENNDGKQKNYRPDEEMQLKLGVQKYLHISQVLAKCDCREDYNLESFAEYNEIEVSVLVHLWNGRNLEQPVFVKLMLKSHTSVGFFLRIPEAFCRRYLPAVDTSITLETKSGELYETRYLARHAGLSGGWRRFAIDQKIVEGDLAVFHLVEATRFKIYNIKKGSSTIKLPTHLLNLYKKARQCVPGKAAYDNQLIAYRRRKVHQSMENSNEKHRDEYCGNTFEVKVKFNNIKGFKDFNTVISELLQNHCLSELLLLEYYDLCLAKKTFLHTHLLKGLNPKFFIAAFRSTISNTVGISIALRTSTPFSFLNKFSHWSKMLTYYEALGMNVSLLKSRLHHLLNLAVRSDGAADRSRYIEACRERTNCERETKKLEMILVKWKKAHVLLASEVKVLESKADPVKYMETYVRFIEARDEVREIEALIADFRTFFERYDTLIETLKLKANKHELQFQEEAGAPW